ncbi:phosphoglucosamine mutase [bacterium]|nr:phosphoglucosamine mutase [bacterium]
MSNERKIFGTDGVRGTANVEPVTAETALRLGRAAAYVFQMRSPAPKGHGRHQIVIGKDTRLSGYMLENAIASGILSMGVDVLLIGPLPTPGVAYITRSLRADAGLVLTASHNPYEDNGIKFFRDDGYKLDDAIEAEIEELVFSGRIESIRPTARAIGKAFRIDDALGRYVEFAKAAFPKGLTLEGLHIVVDTANGAAYKSTPCVLRELGARLTVLNHAPDGTNINKQCGSTHPEVLCQAVPAVGADLGISHDGDGDRVLLCDERGTLVDGDDVLAIAALDALARGQLNRQTLVATVMSNLGLDHALRGAGGRVVRSQVGDRYVLEEMIKGDYNIGGEQSGHMIFRDFTTTGDGIISALQILRIMLGKGRPLGELRKVCTKFPQVVLNVPVKTKTAWEDLPAVQETVRDAERALADQGRVLLRYSGTEPIARVLVEGRDPDQLRQHADPIAEAIRAAIGA